MWRGHECVPYACRIIILNTEQRQKGASVSSWGASPTAFTTRNTLFSQIKGAGAGIGTHSYFSEHPSAPTEPPLHLNFQIGSMYMYLSPNLLPFSSDAQISWRTFGPHLHGYVPRAES